MTMLAIRLFGRLDVNVAGAPVRGLDSRKAQELLAYLLLHRARAHTREALATLFWADASPAKGRKYLRQALWRVHTAVAPSAPCPLVLSDGEWISINPQADLWLDVAVFEQTCAALKASAGEALTVPEAQQLETALHIAYDRVDERPPAVERVGTLPQVRPVPAQPPAPSPAPVVAPVSASSPLTTVAGIGPARDRDLRGLGITTLGQLATARPALVARLRGVSPAMARQYIAQARRLLHS